ncbi:ABC transporter substrate-binding protein [Bradyrhizobium oligotrophicum]|uniref:ABC transporter substrate-binding protein n=1 Tax=Bradyrhizobium oligotrophicum TaxID=44255 RepID=UPI003EBBB013
MTFRWTALLIGTCVATSATAAAPRHIETVGALATRVGLIVGSALACSEVSRPRVQLIVEKFQAVIKEVSDTEADRSELTRLFDRYLADGRRATSIGLVECRSAVRQFADLEQSVKDPPPQITYALPQVAFAPPDDITTIAPLPMLPQQLNVPGVTRDEIKFGTVIPFSGPVKDTGRQLKLGIDVAFNSVNDRGGVNGRKLKLIAADDAYEPTRTLAAMKQLYDNEKVFGYIGNFGAATAEVAVPFALERRVLFFAAFTGANVLRRDPPDRYVFNYRPSFAEETSAIVQHLVKRRQLQPRQIVVFAQNDSLGDTAAAGVAKALRALGANGTAVTRLSYKRNTVDVDEAVNQLRASKIPVKAVVMAATARAAAKFIEKTRDLYPGIIYSNVSFVGSTELANELMLLGPRYTENVIVTQVVPGVSGYSTLVLEYKKALGKYFPGETPSYTSLEGYVAANILIEGLKNAGPMIDTERLVDALEKLRNFNLGLGVNLAFGDTEHQASHKIWGTALDKTGNYQPLELD